jgi:hypothetical protein
MNKIVISVVLILLCSVSHAYEGTPSEQIDSFFRDFSKGKSNEAIDSLYSSNPTMQQKLQALAALKQQMSMVTGLYGPFLGAELVHNEQLSPSVTRLVYIAKHELHPISWEYYFYKPNDKWIISQAVFGDQFQNLGSRK